MRWRSARMAPGSPPAAATGRRGCSTRPPGRSWPGWTTTARCTRWRSARTATRVATGSGDPRAGVGAGIRRGHRGAAGPAGPRRPGECGGVQPGWRPGSPPPAGTQGGVGAGVRRGHRGAAGPAGPRRRRCARWRSARRRPGRHRQRRPTGSARVFDAATGAQLARLDHDGPVCRSGVQPGGTRVATGGGDLGGGRRGCSTRPPGPSWPGWTTTAPVTAVAFSPDGARVATGGDDGRLGCLMRLPGPAGPTGPRRPGDRGGVQPRWRPGRHRQRRPGVGAGVRRGYRGPAGPDGLRRAGDCGGVQP